MWRNWKFFYTLEVILAFKAYMIDYLEVVIFFVIALWLMNK